MSASAVRPCNDFDECGNIADPRYTMDFTNVEAGAFIYWCSTCGPIWHAVDSMLVERLETEPTFYNELKEAMDATSRKQ